ncbi:MAG: M24 family metallopeptidase [Gemmatimonadaceae bacterium]
MRRPHFIATPAGAVGALALGCTPTGVAASSKHDDDETMAPVPPSIRELQPLAPAPVPITNTEREARIDKARQLMAQHKLDAVFFVADGIHLEAPQVQIASATPVTAGGRMIKSAAEIALMQHGNDITITAYKAAWQTLREGMSQDELGRNITTAFNRLGADGDVSVQFGQYTAFPHGSATPQHLKEGDVVMIDDGVKVEGYTSDITRTGVFGQPTQRQRDIWKLERRAQDAGFRAAQVGAPCEAVDAAARKVITDSGFGPGYQVPGLPHRTGHGIGLDGHEWTYFVKGNKTPIQPGMCFSDEPTVAIYGEFGIRLEDCLHVTEAGPKFFTAQAPSIDHLFG